jgi:hypothetical protein
MRTGCRFTGDAEAKKLCPHRGLACYRLFLLVIFSAESAYLLGFSRVFAGRSLVLSSGAGEAQKRTPRAKKLSASPARHRR